MYTKTSAWTFTANDPGRTPVTVAVTVVAYADRAFATLRRDDGTVLDLSAPTTVTRGMALGGAWGNSLRHPIVDVRTGEGDNFGSARTIIGAAEAWASTFLGSFARADVR